MHSVFVHDRQNLDRIKVAGGNEKFGGRDVKQPEQCMQVLCAELEPKKIWAIGLAVHIFLQMPRVKCYAGHTSNPL